VPELSTVLLLALLPGIGVAAGGLIAELVPSSKKWLNWSLHAAAGIVIAIAAIEVLPEALDSVSHWTVGIAFAVGGLTYLGIKIVVEKRAEGSGRMWMIFLAVATDLFGDGLLIGAGTAVSTDLGITLAIGQIMANIPEGFASLSTFRANGHPPIHPALAHRRVHRPCGRRRSDRLPGPPHPPQSVAVQRPHRRSRPLHRRRIRGHHPRGPRNDVRQPPLDARTDRRVHSVRLHLSAAGRLTGC